LTLFYNHIDTSMHGTNQLLDQITITLKNRTNNELLPVYVDVFDNSLSRKWLAALNHLVTNNYHLEKNYCFQGFIGSDRDGWLILDQVNQSIDAINSANIGYKIDDHFTMENTVQSGTVGHFQPGRTLNADRMNWLHRYFEDLQGVSGQMSPYYNNATPEIRWHIRQLNLLCHEFESWVLSWRKSITDPEWMRPSQLMCWLNAPRFTLDEEDYELFGIETINRPLGGVFAGVNKAVGKHHWEVFWDENKDVTELITGTLKGQTEAAGDFDIEWANDPGQYSFQKQHLAEFRQWLIDNGFDPNDKSLTIGHPQVGQVDLTTSFGTNDYKIVWEKLNQHLDVYKICTSTSEATYTYTWSDADFQQKQINRIQQGN